jgi:hypothetical protein
VFAGLDILVPLLSLELLKFPKLCRAYFALLAHMLEVRYIPALLGTAMLRRVLRTLIAPNGGLDILHLHLHLQLVPSWLTPLLGCPGPQTPSLCLDVM